MVIHSLGTVKVIVDEIEKQISKSKEIEKLLILKDIFRQISETKSENVSVGEEQQAQDSVRQDFEKEVALLKEKQQQEMEVLNDKLSAIKMTTGDNIQTESGAATSEVNYQGLQSILKSDFRIVGAVGAQEKKRATFLSKLK